MRALVIVTLVASAAMAQERRADPLPPPDVKDEGYGPHARHVLDLWKAKAEAPTPVLVFIHGGGFRTGSKAQLSPSLLRRCLENGIAVAAINYRLTDTAPFPAPMHDGGRAVQFLRHRAKDWNLDPARVACTGGSAGAGISLWLAFHDDLADPKSEDPVARQSTRLRGALVHQAQCSYDPRFIREHIGGRAHEHAALPPFWGLRRDELTGEKADRIFKACSPITHLTADDPPVYCSYSGRDLPDPERPGAGIHHENFGKVLKAAVEKLGGACTVKVGHENRESDEIAFLRKILK